MLRFDLMASDFNEHFLILGTRSEVAALSAVLRDYARDGGAVDLSERFSNPATTAKLLLEPAEERQQGLHRIDGDGFRWGLMGWQAAIIADGIDKMNAERSGSEIFQLGADNEIPVKISHGEFEDEFLVTKR